MDVTNSGTISDILFYGEENADRQLPECVRELESIVETNEVEIGELQQQLDVLEDNYYNVLQENVSLKDLVESLQTRVNSLEGFQLQEGISTQRYIQPKSNCGVEIIKNDDKATCFYTGIPKYSQFLKLFDLLRPLVPAKAECDLSLMNFLFHFYFYFIFIFIFIFISVYVNLQVRYISKHQCSLCCIWSSCRPRGVVNGRYLLHWI